MRGQSLDSVTRSRKSSWMVYTATCCQQREDGTCRCRPEQQSRRVKRRFTEGERAWKKRGNGDTYIRAMSGWTEGIRGVCHGTFAMPVLPRYFCLGLLAMFWWYFCSVALQSCHRISRSRGGSTQNADHVNPQSLIHRA